MDELKAFEKACEEFYSERYPYPVHYSNLHAARDALARLIDSRDARQGDS